jgi:hypothetical protein
MTQPDPNHDLAHLLNLNHAIEDATHEARVTAAFINTLRSLTNLSDEDVCSLTHHWVDKSYPDATPPAAHDTDTDHTHPHEETT